MTVVLIIALAGLALLLVAANGGGPPIAIAAFALLGVALFTFPFVAVYELLDDDEECPYKYEYAAEYC